jgi:DNA-directed RNA polymerase specialized sigma24 family protein
MDRNADRAVTALYLTQYRPLVALATRLVRDLATAEEIVQDSFVAVHAAWRKRPDADLAPSHLRRSVVDRSRSRLRHRAVVGKLAPGLLLDRLAIRIHRDPELERSAFISALWALPARQREAVVLRYFADLP